ncbi:hypothetical protein CORC01_05437 [Colletotrichum orchidophilum]|uniref:Uncharacterized protein n=1 Tax=Colletotrichum orchidophilum TaxID=1209926 RepID=A0A1G4BCS6_9PEZI|nr:uncharacterized protein CORC01_05437 [Colletotrichum orchidophilum]OHE99156.1 hypothetical protein CORC01_05437 [Colletotrichum orchidophilum]
MATPRPRGGSDELLSSPDPLNDTVSSALYPSSRRVTRSQRSQRLFSLGGSSTSPRKQMFELEVGDDRQPKRLLVTVEAEGDYENVGVGNVGRRLFNAETPTLSRGAYTTTVPLAGDRKNTAIKTPARRGRPPKSAGTPKTGTATKRRATASPRKTPRQARRVKTITDSDGLETDITIQGTPRSTTRTRRATSRQPREVSEGPAPSSIPPSTTRRRGRPKRVEFSDQPVETIEEDIILGGVAPSDDGLAASMEEMIVDDPIPRRELPANPIPESEPDIWMQTMSDQATPRASTQENPIPLSPTPAYMQDKSPTPSDQLHSESGNEPEYNEYDFAPGAPSDISSLIGDNDGNDELRDQDTVAQGEDFSMIFANSIPSMRGHMSMHDLRSEDVGEETGLIINQTLESLRQSGALHVEDDEDEIDSIPAEQLSPAQNPPAEEKFQLQQETEVHMDSIVETNATETESPVALPSLPHPALPPPSLAAKETSPSRRYQSPGRARSSPRRKSIPLGRQLLESKAKQMEMENSKLEDSRVDTSHVDNSFSSVPSRILAAATPGAKSIRRSSMATGETSAIYEEDFSEIPEAYLEAATPGRPKLPEFDESEVQNEIEHEANITSAQEETLLDEAQEEILMDEESREVRADGEDEGEDAEVEAEETEEEARKSSPKSAAPSIASVSYTRSDSARMPTPDDTPSPADVPVPQSDAKTIEAAQSSPTAAYSQLPEELSSDLPVPNLAAGLPAASNEYITPVAPVSSPIPSPDINLLAPRAASPENGARPTLSPIVRAGRALQSVTSDASSPPRQNSLGSPFRPTTSSSQPQSAAKSTRSWTQPLSTLIQAGAQFFGSPTRVVAQPQSEPPAPQLSGQPFDDPFGPENEHTGQPSFMEALSKSMRISPSKQPEVSFSMSGSLHVVPGDEADEMSWMEEAPAPREQPFTQSRSFHASTNTAASGSMRNRRQSFEISLVGPDGAEETEVEEEQPGAEEGEEDDDIWAVEASRPASNSSRQRSFVKQPASSIPARRAALPSPWQKPAEASPKQTIFTPAASRNQKSDFADGELEDFSMLSQQQSRKKQIPQKAFEVAQRSSAKKDLAAFFSSPNLLPGAQGVQEILDKKRLNLKDAAQRPERADAGLETNSMFPSVPQKAFAPSASGRSDLFSPAKPSATKSIADTNDHSDPFSAAKPSSATAKSVMDTRRELFASTNPRSSVRHRSEIPDSQPNMSDEVSFPSVPQKKNFTPNVGQKTQNLFSKVSAPVPSLTPVRMQLSRADIQKWQESSASAIAESSPESERRVLRPLPDRNMSPTKSCLRSPLKPRTPGRVVEFTSSVLSPLAQAQVRAERRLSASSNGSASAAQQQQQQQQRIAAIMEAEDKEIGAAAVTAVVDDDQEMNEDMDISMTDAPGMNEMQKSVEEEPPRLSQTMWSRDHWLLLDDIIQLRREGPFDFEFPDDFTSKSSWLLGRSVNSHGASLKLEQWHLDVVDAFQAEVGVWDEEVLAKRVFSLIVGEQLRKQGKAPEAPSVRFL